MKIGSLAFSEGVGLSQRSLMATWDLESDDALWWFISCCRLLIMVMPTPNGGNSTAKYHDVSTFSFVQHDVDNMESSLLDVLQVYFGKTCSANDRSNACLVPAVWCTVSGRR